MQINIEENKLPSNPYSNKYSQPNAASYPITPPINSEIKANNQNTAQANLTQLQPTSANGQNKSESKNIIGKAKDKILQYGGSLFKSKKS